MPTTTRGLYSWLFHGAATLEDFTDRLNHIWTVGFLLLMAAIINWKHGYSEPIQCWIPVQFTDEMIAYTRSYCWNSHHILYRQPKGIDVFLDDRPRSPTVFRSIEHVEESDGEQLKTETTLYQWVPIILVFQALLFKFPSIVMCLLHGYSGISFDKLAGLTNGYIHLDMTERETLTKQISRYIYNWCNQMCVALPWRFLTVAWLLTKTLFVINVVTQFHILNYFLRTYNPPYDNSTSYGDVIVGNLLTNRGHLWRASPAFPRQVRCKLVVNLIGRGPSDFLMPCDIPGNEFTEVAFMLLWVWYVIVTIATCTSYVVWLVQMFLPLFRQRYISKMLRMSENVSSLPSTETSKFANWIGEDGVMALKLIGSNSSDLIVSDIVCSMWKRRQGEVGTNPSGLHGQPVYTGSTGTSPGGYMPLPQDQPHSTSQQPVHRGNVLYPVVRHQGKLD